ncbi:MAG: hypothetical protein ACI906_002689 [Candidatus Latescibacterota bacterium]|jgi:hypothetical protein
MSWSSIWGAIGLGNGGQAFDAPDGMLDPDTDTGAPGWVGLKAKSGTQGQDPSVGIG